MELHNVQCRLTRMKKRFLFILLTALFVSCNFPVPLVPANETTLTPSPKASPTPSDKPGMVVRGQVTVNGVGLAGVEIYQNFAAYPANLIAVTDENGYYESLFIGIPSDEMIGLEPRLDGYTFDTPYYSWRHYHGYETTTYNFVALPAP